MGPGIPKSHRPKTDPIPAGTKRTSSGQVMYETYKQKTPTPYGAEVLRRINNSY